MAPGAARTLSSSKTRALGLTGGPCNRRSTGLDLGPILAPMRDSAPQQSLEQSPLARNWVAKLLFAGSTLAVVTLVIWPVVKGDRDLLQVLSNAALPGFLLVLVMLVASRHEKRWSAAVGAMNNLISELRTGESATEDLAALGEQSQELAELAERISILCRDLKDHKHAVAALETAIQRRVATRTGRLERKLGKLRARANRDALTGIGNRGAFDAAFPIMVERAKRAEADLCVIMIDVDHFKHLNDSMGHSAGDEYLRKVGQLIRAAVRERDQAFRYGGDEFVLVLWNTSAPAGRATAKRLGDLSEELAQQYELAEPPRLSCGIASLGETLGATPEELLRVADESLYRHKNSRKNRSAA